MFLQWDIGIATHTTLALQLDCGYNNPYMSRPRQAPLRGVPRAGWGLAAAAEASAQQWRSDLGTFQTTLSLGDLDDAWQRLNRAALRFASD